METMVFPRDLQVGPMRQIFNAPLCGVSENQVRRLEVKKNGGGTRWAPAMVINKLMGPLQLAQNQ